MIDEADRDGDGEVRSAMVNGGVVSSFLCSLQ